MPVVDGLELRELILGHAVVRGVVIAAADRRAVASLTGKSGSVMAASGSSVLRRWNPSATSAVDPAELRERDLAQHSGAKLPPLAA